MQITFWIMIAFLIIYQLWYFDLSLDDFEMFNSSLRKDNNTFFFFQSVIGVFGNKEKFYVVVWANSLMWTYFKRS